MEPRIQYAKTKDEVSIAYATTGEGSPLVVCPFSREQFSLSRQIPSYHALIERIGRGRLLVQYDGRGTGLSERNVKNFSLEARLEDLEAVVRAARIRPFALYGTLLSGVVAIAYAARHQRQVSQLILYGTFSRGADVMPRERLKPLIELCRNNWELASQLFADMSSREQHPEEGVQLANVVRASCTGEVGAEIFEQGYAIDVNDLLPLVKAPTLVLHRRGDAVVSFALGQKLASGIPNARFVPLDGTIHVPYLGDTETVIGAIDEFLGRDVEARVAGPKLAMGDVHTILFTDIEGSTALTQRLGDARAQELLRTHNTIVRDSLKAHSGTETKHTGDGIMASFQSASKALEAAVGIQKAFADHNKGNADSPIRIRIGLNAGEPVAEDEDLFGTAVQLAARVCAQAEPGQILTSNVVQELAAGKGFTFTDKGEAELKGFEKPVRLHEVWWQD